MFDDNTKTVMAFDEILEANPDEWIDYLTESTEYAMELANRNPILEGIVVQLKRSGSSFEEKDIKSIRKELNKRYKNIGIEDGVPKAVKNWLEGTPVNTAYRANLYNLCIALEMNIEEVKEFFLKRYMTIPFNYKDRVDAIYYYGITHKLSYREIKTILDEFDTEEINAEKNDYDTQHIGESIADIDNLEKFKEYIRKNTYTRKGQFNKGYEIFNDLAKNNARLAEMERIVKVDLRRQKEKKNASEYKDKNASGLLDEHKLIKDNGDVNFKSLLYVIYAYDDQERRNTEEQKTITKSVLLPKAFRENFTNDEEISRIINKTATADVYRKAIIIMNFYNFFCSRFIQFIYGTTNPQKDAEPRKRIDEYRSRSQDNIPLDAEDFYYETSELLAKCGFIQMYVRNPFDWLILYCAMSTDPLETFRLLLEERFLDYEYI